MQTTSLDKKVAWLLAVSGILAAIAAVQLYIGADTTARYFAWTINPPIAAAFIGAHFFAVVVMAWAAAKEKLREQARYFLPTVFAFASVMLLATLLHSEKFHFGSPFLTARGAAWAWMIVYVGVPIAGAWAIWKERAMEKPARSNAPLPVWMKLGLGVYSCIFLVAGLVSFIVPELVIKFWPWAVTPLIVRASSAMLIALGITATTLVRENTSKIIMAPFLGLLLLSVFHMLSLVRYQEQLIVGLPFWVYIILLLDMFAFSLLALVWARRHSVR